jgi:hypothetical protein
VVAYELVGYIHLFGCGNNRGNCAAMVAAMLAATARKKSRQNMNKICFNITAIVTTMFAVKFAAMVAVNARKKSRQNMKKKIAAILRQ